MVKRARTKINRTVNPITILQLLSPPQLETSYKPTRDE